MNEKMLVETRKITAGFLKERREELKLTHCKQIIKLHNKKKGDVYV